MEIGINANNNRYPKDDEKEDVPDRKRRTGKVSQPGPTKASIETTSSFAPGPELISRYGV